MKKKLYPSRYPMKVAFSRSAVVGNYIFVSGCSGQTLQTFHVSSDDVADQTEVALDKIRSALEETGSSMNHIVKTVLYLTNMDDLAKVNKKRQEYYQRYAPELINNPPADTVIGIAGLHEPDMLVEIEAIAILPESN